MSEQAASASVSQPHVVVRAVLRTDVGLVRSENQDFGTYTTPAEERSSHPGGRLLIVADGMGGHRGGATASRLAAETVKAQFLGSETTDIPTALRESLLRANARIFSEAQANPELRGMGTTTSVLAVRGDQGWLAHVGDSRIYLVRNDAIQQLTDDHSLVATMVREGLLTSAEAETHPRRNVLQRSMGVAEDVEVDVRGPIELRAGDTFILCSDGLHGLVKEPELKEIARGPIDKAADEFLRRALERGAPDNVTVIVARVETTDLDETVVDHLDETQPLSSLDETMKDTQPLAPVTEADMQAAQAAPPPPPAAPTLEQAAPVEPLAKTEEIVFAPDPEPSADVHDDTVDTAEVVFDAVPAPAAPPTVAVADEEVKTAEVDFQSAPKPAPAPPAAAAPVPEADPALKTTEVPIEPAAAAAQHKAEPVTAAPRPAANPKTTTAAPARASSSSMLLWLVVIVVVLGAAGAWFYWNQQQASAKESKTTTAR